MKKCCVIGLGYIGLPTAAIIANANHEVIGVDINEEIVNTINSGNVHFFEPGLKKLVKEMVSLKKLKSNTNPCEADVFIIAVPTPFKESKTNIPEPNIDYVLSAAEKISPYLKDGDLIIIESTSPVGTTEKIKSTLKKSLRCDIENIHICYCPERVIPGNIIQELQNNNRIIGGIKAIDSQIARKFYKTFCKGEINLTDAKTAELIKLTENTFRDINIAFANELSIICDKFKVDVKELINLSNKHPRVNILQPGCGVGGHCIAIDPWFLASALPESSKLIQTARRVNNEKVLWVINKIKETFRYLKKKNGRNPVIGCLGLTFKPNVDDIRESPAKKIVENLYSSNHELLLCEPNLKFFNDKKLETLDYVIDKSDFIVILVAHYEFKNINLKNKIYIDFCGAIS
tara:strand:+ start:30 stop:1238 length:1209 start_codon:yes stop_codon:yes gene_type:complete